MPNEDSLGACKLPDPGREDACPNGIDCRFGGGWVLANAGRCGKPMGRFVPVCIEGGLPAVKAYCCPPGNGIEPGGAAEV